MAGPSEHLRDGTGSPSRSGVILRRKVLGEIRDSAVQRDQHLSRHSVLGGGGEDFSARVLSSTPSATPSQLPVRAGRVRGLIPFRVPVWGPQTTALEVAFPFTNVTLRVRKPLPAHWPRDPQTVGERLKRARLELGLTQKELAERLGVAKVTVASWESGRRRPSVGVVSLVEGLGALCLDSSV